MENLSDSEIASTAKVYSNVLMRNSVIGENCTIGDDCLILDADIKDYVAINRRNYIQKSSIGEFTYTNFNTVIRHSKIGKFCSISWNVSIGGKNHDYSKVSTHSNWRFNKAFANKNILNKDYELAADCLIGNDVWIAANVVILRDLTIGNGAVIGAGSIITKDVEPYSIVVGNPGKMIKKRFNENIIAALEEIQWWNWPPEIIDVNQDLIYSKKVDERTIKKLKEISNSLK